MVQHLYFIYLVGGLFTDPASTGTVLVTGHTAHETSRRVVKVTLTSGLEIKISGFPRDLIPPTNPTPEVIGQNSNLSKVIICDLGGG